MRQQHFDIMFCHLPITLTQLVVHHQSATPCQLISVHDVSGSMDETTDNAIEMHRHRVDHAHVVGMLVPKVIAYEGF